MSLKIKITTVLTAFFLLAPALNIHAQTVNLDVPYYSQGKDESWAEETLGNRSSLTIKTHGCALTAISMVASYFYGGELNPSEMNRWLRKNDGFEGAWDGGRFLGEVSLNWPSLAEFRDGMVYTRFNWNALPADLVLIRYYLDNAIPVIAEVEYRGAPHYVVLKGWDKEQGFMMNDPEFPDISLFNNLYNTSDKWGSGPSRNIYGIRVLYPADYR